MPDPIEAGYWPYNTVDGHLAAGDPGATGDAWRSFAEEDAEDADSDIPRKQLGSDGDDMDDDVDKYLDAESSIYTNDMRFYVDDDWP